MESFYNNEYTESCEFLQNIYLNIVRNLTANSVASNTNNDLQISGLTSRLQHPVVRNYINIIKNKRNFRLEIIEKDILTGREMVAYKKTFWLRILQKKWKSNYYRKMHFYKNPKNIFLRQINGR